MNIRPILFAVGLAVAASGCSGPELTAFPLVPAVTANLMGRTLLSTSVTDRGGAVTIDGSRRQFMLSFRNSNLSVTSGCNPSGTGSWRMVAGTLVVDQGLAMSLVSCPGREFEQDKWFDQILGARPQIYTYGPEVVVDGSDAVLEFVDGTWDGPGSPSPPNPK